MKMIYYIFLMICIGCGNSPDLFSSTDQHGSSENHAGLEKGNFAEGSFEDCGPGGVEHIAYKYRIGEWVFYYPNGQVKAKGSYEPVIAEISTRCQENARIKFSGPRNDWEFYDQAGEEVEFGQQLKVMINCVTQEEDEFLDIMFCYNSKENEVIQEVTTK